MSFGSGYLKGLRKAYAAIFASGTSYSTPFEFEAPQLLDLDEESAEFNWPGGDAIAETGSKPKSLKAKLRWGKLSLEAQAKLIGARYSLAGTDPNQEAVLDRRTTDIAPYFKLEGVVKYIGAAYPNGDYHFVGFYGVVTKPPKFANETDKETNVEMEVKFIERPADSAFYQMRMYQSGKAAHTTLDATAAVFTTSPLSAGVHPVANNLTATANKPIVFLESNYKVFRSVSSILTQVATANTYDPTTGIVTINPSADLAAASSFVLEIKDVIDLAGNTTATMTVPFTTA